ncbi:MAG: hypothetical protein MUC49_03495 [Raineya sp.]|jgi:tetratricopeptide (TPR) repeat protein|nr:hypothetical protein [Raineya sp.]
MSKQITNFFEKALEIQNKKREKLTEAEKKEIALELGFSEEEWQAFLDSFQAHLERGKTYLELHNYTEAISELQEALVIQPENIDVLSHISWAYLGLFHNKKRKSDKIKALDYAKECLQYAPKNILAHQVINEFNSTKKKYNSSVIDVKESFTKSSHQKSTKSPLKEILIFIGCVGTILLLFYLTFPKFEPKNQKKESSKTKTIHKEDQTRKATSQSPTKNSLKRNFNIPIILQNTDNDYCTFVKQNDSTWLAKSLKGEELFLFQVSNHYLKFNAQIQNEKIISSELTYSPVFILTFLTNHIQKRHFTFSSNWEGLSMGGYSPNHFLKPYVPDHVNYKKGDIAYIRYFAKNTTDFKFPSSIDSLNFKNSKFILDLKADWNAIKNYKPTINSVFDFEPKDIRVLYQGKPYQEIAFKTRATSAYTDNQYQSMGITFEIKNQDSQNRSLQMLEFKMVFYTQNGMDTISQESVLRISKAINTHLGDLKLKPKQTTFYHTNKSLFIDNYKKIAPKYEIHITNINWE